MLVLLDKAFFAFHTLFIVFNMVGWAWRRTRLLHLIALGLTACSWFVLGAFYGWGYCVCTAWHFQVRRRLAIVDPETSYIQLLIGRLLRIPLTRSQSNRLAMGVFALIVIATLFVWVRDFYRLRLPVATAPGVDGGEGVNENIS